MEISIHENFYRIFHVRRVDCFLSCFWDKIIYHIIAKIINFNFLIFISEHDIVKNLYIRIYLIKNINFAYDIIYKFKFSILDL